MPSSMTFDVQGLKYGKLFLKRSFLPAFLHYFRICSLNLTFLLTVTPRSFCCPFFPNPTFSNISKHMVAAPLILGGHLKISDPNLRGISEHSWEGGSYPPFSKILPFLEIQDFPTFHRSFRKTKVLNNSCNQFVYHFYRQSILVLKECLQKW